MHSGKTLHEIFEEQAARFPDRIAVTSGGEHIDYATLNARADQLARRIAGARDGSSAGSSACARNAVSAW